MNLVTVENTSKEAIQGNEFVHIIAIFSLILQYAPSNVPNIGRGFRSHRSMSHNFLLYQVKANTNNDSFPWTVLQKKKKKGNSTYYSFISPTSYWVGVAISIYFC